MTDEIPYIQFKSNYTKIKGIEIITLEGLFSRKEDLDHHPENAHQLDFYMLVF